MSDTRTDDTEAPALHCAHCDYNLTGLLENRCPECGQTFDSTELRQRSEDVPASVPGWDDHADRNLVRRFLATCVRVWFRPTKFIRCFPNVSDSYSSLRFSVLVRLSCGVLAVGIGLFLDILTYVPVPLGYPTNEIGVYFSKIGVYSSHVAVLAWVLIIVVGVLTELFLSLMFFHREPGRAIPVWKRWWRLYQFLTAYQLLLFVVTGTFIVIAGVTPWRVADKVYALAFLMCMIIPAWWFYALSRAYLVRLDRRRAAIGAIVSAATLLMPSLAFVMVGALLIALFLLP